MEFLVENKHSISNISNYLAAIRAFHIIHGSNTEPLKDERIQLFLKSLPISAPLTSVNKSISDIDILQNIMIQCQVLPHPIILKHCI